MSEKLEEFDNRIIFAKTLIALANENPNIVVVCNDSVGSSNLGEFRDLFPDRLIDVGIAEQNMVGMAAGLSQQDIKDLSAFFASIEGDLYLKK